MSQVSFNTIKKTQFNVCEINPLIMQNQFLPQS